MTENFNTNVERGREYLRCKLAHLLWEQKVPRPDSDGHARDGNAAEQFLAKHGPRPGRMLERLGSCTTYEEFEKANGFEVYRHIFPLLVVGLKEETHPKMARTVSYVGSCLVAILKTELTVKEGVDRQEIDITVATKLMVSFWIDLVSMANLAETPEAGYQAFLAQHGEKVRRTFYDRAWYVITPEKWPYEQPLPNPRAALEEAVASLEREQHAGN